MFNELKVHCSEPESLRMITKKINDCMYLVFYLLARIITVICHLRSFTWSDTGYTL